LGHTLGYGLGLLFYHFPGHYALGVRNPFAQAFIDLIADSASLPEVILRLFAAVPVTEGMQPWPVGSAGRT
jgi:hypothetical protein